MAFYCVKDFLVARRSVNRSMRWHVLPRLLKAEIGTNPPRRAGKASPLCPGTSDINLFRYCQSVIDLDAKIPDRAFDLGMTEQELNGPQVACSSIDQCRFCTTQ
jgi:hypothetical protein